MSKKKTSEISYQNKDITSKIFGEQLKNEYLDVYGVNVPRIIDVRPTNLPDVSVNELRLDNLFIFEDGTVGIIDYESKFKKKNIVKYLNYISRIVKRWLSETGDFPKLRLIIIYTGDVARNPSHRHIDFGCLTLTLNEGFLCEIDGEAVYNEIRDKLQAKQPLSQQDIMRLVILPLSFRGKHLQQQYLIKTIDLAEEITDNELYRSAFAGILAFSDKIISQKQSEDLRRRLQMTKVERIINREIQDAVDRATIEVTEQVTEQVTERVTRNLLFDLVNTGLIPKEEGIRRTGMNDEEFSRGLAEYALAH